MIMFILKQRKKKMYSLKTTLDIFTRLRATFSRFFFLRHFLILHCIIVKFLRTNYIIQLSKYYRKMSSYVKVESLFPLKKLYQNKHFNSLTDIFFLLRSESLQLYNSFRIY